MARLVLLRNKGAWRAPGRASDNLYLRVRRGKPGDNLWAKLLEVAAIPRNDLTRTGLDGATSNQAIVNGSARNPIGGSLPNGVEIRLAIETDQAESAGDGLNAL